MPANDDSADVEFHNKTGEVRVADKYESVTLADGRTITAGDIVVVEDRDIDHRDHERGVTQRIFVGFVESVGDMKRDGWGPELFISAGIGRVDPTDNNVHVSGEGSLIPSETGLSKFVDQFLNETGIDGHTVNPVQEADVTEMRIEWSDDGVDRTFA